MKKNYYIIIDTETLNGNDDMLESLPYNVGFCIIDKKGHIYEKYNFVTELYTDCPYLMQSCYFADKIPFYEQGIQDKSIKFQTFTQIKYLLNALCQKYNIKAIMAHNALFDYRALNKGLRYSTKSKYRYFLPYGVEVWDTLKMARSVIAPMPTYKKWCKDNGYITKNGQPRLTAEIIYRFISGQEDFKEDHTALSDTLIEKDIFVYCLNRHKKLEKKLFND